MNRWLCIAVVVVASSLIGWYVVEAVTVRWDYAINAAGLACLLYGFHRTERARAAQRFAVSYEESRRLGELLNRLARAGHTVRLEHVSHVLGWDEDKTRAVLEVLRAQGVLTNWED